MENLKIFPEALEAVKMGVVRGGGMNGEGCCVVNLTKRMRVLLSFKLLK